MEKSRQGRSDHSGESTLPLPTRGNEGSVTDGPSVVVEELQQHTYGAKTTPGIGWMAGIFNLSSAVVSLGVLVQPFTLRQSGYVLGLVMMLFSGFCTALSFSALAEASEAVRRLGKPNVTYENLCSALLGPWGSWFVDLNLFMLLFFSMCAFLITIVGLVSCPLYVWIGGHHDWCQAPSLTVRAVFFASLVVLVLPICLPSNLAPLKYPSMFSLVFFAYVLVTMAVRAADEVSDRQSFIPIGSEPAIFDGTIVHTFALQSLLYGRQVNVPPLCKELNSSRFSSQAVLWTSSIIGVVASGCFAVAGFVTWGSSVSDNVLMMYEPDDTLINSGRIILGASLLLKIPLLVMPLRTVTTKISLSTFKCLPEATASSFSAKVVLTWLLLVFGAVTALFLKSLKNVLGVCGFTCAPIVSYIVPGALVFTVWWKQRQRRQSISTEAPLLANEVMALSNTNDTNGCGLLFISLFLMVVGSVMAIGTAVIVVGKWLH